MQEIRSFSLAQYEDGGEKKWELNGKSAEVEGAKVKINTVSAIAFGEDMALKLKAKEGSFNREGQMVHLEDNVVVKATDGTMLTTDSLEWDARTRNVFTEEHVNIKKTDFQLDGKGAECDLENRSAEIKSDVTAFMRSPDPGLSVTTITCDGPLDINYRKSHATFHNNVKVEGGEGNIFSDRIDLYFSQDTRRIRCVVARGNVRIVNGESVTYSEKAVYLVDQGRMVLPKRPKLVIEGSYVK